MSFKLRFVKTTASVALYSSITSTFKVPRPRTNTGQGPFVLKEIKESETIKDLRKAKSMQQYVEWVLNNKKLIAQGATYSTIKTSNNYNVGTLTGNMPNETQVGVTQTAKGELTAPGVPLDNPPMSGCSIPIHSILPSMSKGVGIEPTVCLQFHHGMLHREPDSLRDVEETRIESLCSRKGYLTTFNVTTSDTVGQELLNIPLNSLLSNPTPASSNLTPLNVAILNQFARWRADIEIEIFMAKTVFHSCRLLCVVGYGENGSLASLNYSAYPNRISEYTGENQWTSTRIPYNAPTEFLRTYDGSVTSAQNLDDYSMGMFSVIVLSPLRASSTVVSTSCNCYVFVRFRNVQVFEPRSSTFVSLENGSSLFTLYGQGPLRAQMDATEAIRKPESSDLTSNGRTTVIERFSGDENEPVVVSVTKDQSRSDEEPVCSLKIGSKYEYLIRDFTEIGRRHTIFNVQTIDGYSAATYYGPIGFNVDYSDASAWKLSSSISFYVYPLHITARVFAGWSGHLKYRFVFTGTPSNAANSLLANFKVTYVPSREGKTTQTVNTYSGTVPPAAGTANTTMFDHIVAFPGETQVGKTGTSSTATWNANTYIQRPEVACSPTPLEYSISQGGGMSYIDVSVPFTSNNNYLPTYPSLYNGTTIDPYNGRLIITLPRNFGDYTENFELYQAFGDDFRLHAYSPVFNHYADGYNKSGTITAPSGGIQIGQNVYGDHP